VLEPPLFPPPLFVVPVAASVEPVSAVVEVVVPLTFFLFTTAAAVVDVVVVVSLPALPLALVAAFRVVELVPLLDPLALSLLAGFSGAVEGAGAGA
jgi:hypothetical protein